MPDLITIIDPIQWTNISSKLLLTDSFPTSQPYPSIQQSFAQTYLLILCQLCHSHFRPCHSHANIKIDFHFPVTSYWVIIKMCILSWFRLQKLSNSKFLCLIKNWSTPVKLDWDANKILYPIQLAQMCLYSCLSCKRHITNGFNIFFSCHSTPKKTIDDGYMRSCPFLSSAWHLSLDGSSRYISWILNKKNEK